ncbi:MAG: hypothetical protein WCR42_11680 [bacterium]
MTILIAIEQSLKIQFKLKRGTTVNSDELTNGTDLQEEHLNIDVPQEVLEVSPLENGQEDFSIETPQDLPDITPLENGLENIVIESAQDLTDVTPLENLQVDESEAQSGELIKKYDSDEEYKNAYDGVFKEISEWGEHAKVGTDWKLLRNNQVELRGALKMLFLTKEDSKKLSDIIDEYAEVINQRQNSERMEKDKIFENNYNQYKEKVIFTTEKANATTLFKEGRDLLIKLQDEIKPVQLKRSQRDEFFSLIQAAFLAINEKQANERENFEMECIENYHSLKKTIQNACDFSRNSNRFSDARKKLIETQQIIKGRRLRREQRDELYQTIREHFEELNLRQSADRSVNEEEIGENYGKLTRIVSEAIEFANNTEEYSEARARLISAQNEIKALKLNRNQRDELYAQIRGVFTTMNETQSSERESYENEAEDNYAKLTDKVNNSFELVLGLTDFRLIRENLLAIQGEVRLMRLKRGQRNELFSRLREAFNLFDKRRDEFFSGRREERKRKFVTLLDNMNAKISRLEELKAKDLELLTHLQNENSDEEQINAINERIKEKDAQMAEAQNRLAELQKEINDLDKQKDAPEEDHGFEGEATAE